MGVGRMDEVLVCGKVKAVKLERMGEGVMDDENRIWGLMVDFLVRIIKFGIKHMPFFPLNAMTAIQRIGLL